MKMLLVKLGRGIFGRLGLLAAKFSTSPFESGPVLFLATPDMGGAEKIHADIVAAISEQKPTVVFTEVPKDSALLPEFKRYAKVVQLGGKLQSRAGAYFQAGKLAGWLNKTKPSIVFGAFSHLFYDLLPMLKSEIQTADLLHNFGVNFENYSLPHVARLNQRIVISETLKDDLANLYQTFGIGHAERIAVINNATEVPVECPDKTSDGPLRILYIGRGSPEKRVHLVGQIAAKLDASIARLTLVGYTESHVAAADREFCTFTGVITDREALNHLLRESHVLLLTSEREGLPVALLEAMAHGVVPVSTAVGAIPEAIVDGQNGKLIEASDGDSVVESAVEIINKLAKHRPALLAMSKAAHQTALEKYSSAAFNTAWQRVFGGGNG
ncbi:MAG: glycosyltransferase family 4 protein [Planctomycetota bacterium]